MTIAQPFPKPETVDEYQQLRPQMIDTLGRPLVLGPCAVCRRPHFTVEPHASDVPCPDCGSVAARCVRPSEHEASAWHKARVRAFDALCDEREAAGLPVVARWP